MHVLNWVSFSRESTLFFTFVLQLQSYLWFVNCFSFRFFQSRYQCVPLSDLLCVCVWGGGPPHKLTRVDNVKITQYKKSPTYKTRQLKRHHRCFRVITSKTYRFRSQHPELPKPPWTVTVSIGLIPFKLVKGYRTTESQCRCVSTSWSMQVLCTINRKSHQI